MDDMLEKKLRGFDIRLKVRPGVFSRKGIDRGSELLLDSITVSDGTTIADLGCGTGVIGFVAAKLNPSGYVHLFDVNLRITELAAENAELNRLKNVEVYLSDLFSAVGDRTYHQILSNPPLHLGNDFLNEAAAESYRHLKPKGSMVWVVQKRLKPLIKRIFMTQFNNFAIIGDGKDYIVAKAEKIENK